MRVVLAVVARDDNGSSPSERREAIEEVVRIAKISIGHAIPVRESRLAREIWFSPHRTAAAISWSNEGEVASQVTVGSDTRRWVGLVGYSNPDLDLTALGDAEDLLEASTRLPGCFAIVRAFEGKVEAVTDATRSNNLYVAETERVRLVTSRAVLAKLTAATATQATQRPVLEPDLIGARHLAVAGYYLGDRTPFLGVRSLPPWSCVTLSSTGTSSKLAEVPFSPREDDRGRRAALESAAGAMIEAFGAIPKGRLELSLTGGRDSRLLAAALSNLSDFDVETLTIGTPDDPDVVIGKRVAETLGFPHRVVAPEGSDDDTDLWAEDPLTRIVRVLDVYDGMTSAWDGSPDYPDFDRLATMSGAGGEILRGSVVWREQLPLKSDVVSVRLRNLFLGGSFIGPDMRRAAAPDGAELLDLVQRDPYRAADDFYRVHRAGRWAAARRSSERAWRDNVDPFLDNVFVREVVSVHPEVRWPERFTFDLIGTLAPALRDLPIEGRRWHFERESPMRGASQDEAAGWGARHELTRGAAVDRRLWHKLDDFGIRERVTSLILDSLDSRAAEIFDRAALEEYLTPGARGSAPNIIWNIATAVVGVRLPWYRTTRPPVLVDIAVPRG